MRFSQLLLKTLRLKVKTWLPLCRLSFCGDIFVLLLGKGPNSMTATNLQTSNWQQLGRQKEMVPLLQLCIFSPVFVKLLLDYIYFFSFSFFINKLIILCLITWDKHGFFCRFHTCLKRFTNQFIIVSIFKTKKHLSILWQIYGSKRSRWID